MKFCLCIGVVLYSAIAFAQDSVMQKKFEFRGYIKDMQTLTFNEGFEELLTGNLIHNRLNFKLKPVKGFTAALEMRNRLFWGEEVRFTPDFSSGLRYSSESVNLSHTWFETESMVLHTNIDRLWIEYATGKWSMRAGRQRINWGIATTWNPNDVFNTYNFLDFDYEERPACDAVKAQYRMGNMSNLEVAASKTAGPDEKMIASARYFTNRWTYDFQFLAGWYLNQPTAGAGWSGSIGNAGFKGESQYFFERDTLRDQFNMVIESDYIFENGWYLNVSGLYNSRGIDEPITLSDVAVFQLSPRQPMPTKWNVLTAVSKQITPLFTATVSCIYAPQTNLLILLPSLQYNVVANIDVDFVWQSFFAEQPEGFTGLSHRIFLRFKWSF